MTSFAYLLAVIPLGADQPGCIAFHRKSGFEPVQYMPEIEQGRPSEFSSCFCIIVDSVDNGKHFPSSVAVNIFIVWKITFDDSRGIHTQSREIFLSKRRGGADDIFPETKLSGRSHSQQVSMYVNAALNYKNVQPGQYPSAGPLPHLMDIWQAGAPSIDILSPDFYNPYYRQYCDLYTRRNNTLFIPEIRSSPDNAAKVFLALGHYRGMS